MRNKFCLFWVCWGLVAEDRKPFDFEAREGATLGDVAVAASEWSSRSYVLPEGAASKAVRGRVYGLREAEILSVLAHWSGLRYQEIGGAVFFGSEDKPAVVALPGYGIEASAVSQALGSSASSVGDRLLVRATRLESDELDRALKPLGDRASVMLELFGLVTTTNEMQRMNPWLERFNLGATWREGFPESDGQGSGETLLRNGLHGVADISVFLRLLEDGSMGRIELREQVQVLSGSKSRFESGQVIEDELITREPETGKDLVSRIERRTVGITLTLAGSRLEGKWFFKLMVEDGTFVGTTEVKTLYEGERLVRDGEDWFVLARYQRKTWEKVERGVPLLKSVPYVGKAFRRSDGSAGVRDVVLLARVVRNSAVTGPGDWPESHSNFDAKSLGTASANIAPTVPSVSDEVN